MKKEDILKKVDHTNLNQNAKWEDIKKICDDGIKYNVASVCIPPSYIDDAKKYVGDKLKISTVVGFPNGYSTTNVKIYETLQAIESGADEIDMVININALKDKKYKYIEEEIKAIKMVCANKILKVIIETCLLTNDEKIKMCEIIKNSGADYIKTSTGFSTSRCKYRRY